MSFSDTMVVWVEAVVVVASATVVLVLPDEQAVAKTGQRRHRNQQTFSFLSLSLLNPLIVGMDII